MLIVVFMLIIFRKICVFFNFLVLIFIDVVFDLLILVFKVLNFLICWLIGCGLSGYFFGKLIIYFLNLFNMVFII